jgi:hypothetical protein
VKVEVGQRWVDRDKRENLRVMRVAEITPTHAVLVHVLSNHHKTKIRLDRLPKTWRLIDHAV